MKALLLCGVCLTLLHGDFASNSPNLIQDSEDNFQDVDITRFVDFPESADDQPIANEPSNVESEISRNADYEIDENLVSKEAKAEENIKKNSDHQLETILDSLKKRHHGHFRDNRHRCALPLGMENGRIPDSAMSASSYAALPGARASRSRLNTVSVGASGFGAWVGLKNDGKQWLKIDLGDIARVTRVVTQGRYDGNQWSTQYTLSYSIDNVHWADYKINSLIKHFSGNTDRNTIVGHNLVPYIEARFVRFNVKSAVTFPALRVELYGCRRVHSCTVPIGIEDGRIPDSAMTASSILSNAFAAKEARLNKQAYCWIPKTQNTAQYLRIDLAKEYSVTKVTTQGRYNILQFVKTYTLKSSIDGSHWIFYKQNGVTKVFAANTDGATPVSHVLNPRIETRFIQFNPVTWQLYIAMRVEVYGCPSKPSCYLPLGLEDGRIPNAAMTGSNPSAPSGRLNGPNAFSRSANDLYQFVQVDFVRVVKVTGVATQGSPKYNHYVKQYAVSYAVDDAHWVYVRKYSKIKIFSGNNDKNTIIKNDFDPPLFARYVKLHPRAWHANIEFRMELYGCSADSSCFKPLGLEDRRIPDQSFSASSFYNVHYTPKNARLNNVIVGVNKGSWLAKTNDVNQWLQVDVSRTSVITKMAIQGRYEGVNYVQSYKVSYSQDGVHWTWYKWSSGAIKVFGGNADQHSLVFNHFSPSISAKFVRVHPTTWRGHIAMRMELYGCYLVNNCMMPLGVEDGRIPDAAMKASSEHGAKYGPKYARLNIAKTANHYGGWCAKSNDVNQWIQIELTQPTLITKIGIQGREDGANWVKTFKLEFSYDTIHWAVYKHESIVVVFPGSFDRHTIQVHRLHPAIYAKYLRLRPLTWQGHICMRMEVYGCIVNGFGNMAVTT